jgi:hypothetical protein
MEHRFGTRRLVRAAVVLHTRGAAPVLAYTREVSIGGMFVETPPEALGSNTVIDVELTLPGAAGLRTYRWQAMVIRTTAAGVGLMFDRLRPPAIIRLLARLPASVDAGLPEVPATGAGAGKVVTLRPTAEKTQPQL